MNTLKTKIIELPTFEQLTESEQEKVIENYSDINVDSNFWHEHIIEEAAELGLKISGFDIDRGSIDYGFTQEAIKVAQAIIKEHGETCETYKSAKNFLYYYDRVSKEDAGDDSAEQDNLVSEFETNLANDYLELLRKNYEYCTSEEAIKETLIANEYTFNRETLEIDN